MALRIATHLKSLPLGILLIAFSLAGCNQQVIIYPITPHDIFSIPKGAKVEWDDDVGVPGDLIFVEKPGWFISDFYMQEVMKARETK